MSRKNSKSTLNRNAAIGALLLSQQSEEHITDGGTHDAIARSRSLTGCDPFLRIDTVVALVGLSVPTIYRLMSRGDFPRPLQLTRSARGWKLSDVTNWMHGRELKNGNSCGRE